MGKNYKQDLEVGSSTSFYSSLAETGHLEAGTIDDSPDAIICVDIMASEKKLLFEGKKRGIPLILVKQEPKVVFPLHRYPNPYNLFDLVISKGQPNVSEPFNYGNVWPKTISNFDEERKNRFIAVTANKWSAVPGQLYDLRRRVYHHDERIDLFGRGWNQTFSDFAVQQLKEIAIAAKAGVLPMLPNPTLFQLKPKNYFGEIPDKSKVMSEYDFSIVIENSASYTSEKLMDSLLAGNLVVYVGASLIRHQLPKEFVIQADPNLLSVISAMNKMANVDARIVRSQLREWLREESSETMWSAKSINSRIIQRIVAFVEQRRLDNLF